MTNQLTNRIILLIALCGLFILLGTLLIPFAGIQNDEALFANPIYQNQFEFKISLFGHDIPLMVMSYIGTVKTACYWAWFKLWPPGLYSLRLPMIVLGAVTIYFFSILAKRVSNSAGGWIAAVLLATDPIFLLTNTFDWGPVAIEHFLLVAGCLLLVRFSSEAGMQSKADSPDSNVRNAAMDGLKGRRFLSWGFFLLGLALWNKAIFLASLVGLTVAAVTVCWTRIRPLIAWNRAGSAALALVLGAAPLLLYNARRSATTLKANVNLEIPNWSVKLPQLRGSLDGSGVFGYLTALDNTHPKPVISAIGRGGQWLRARLGDQRQGGLLVAFLLSLLLVPMWWRSAAARFSLIFCLVQWSLVISMRDGGTGVHHVVLLWPFPHLFIAATLSRLPWKKLTWVAAAAIGAANLLVISQYFLEFEKNGAGLGYSDAMIRLSGRIPQYSASKIYVTDWGIRNTLAMLHEGKLRLETAEGAFRQDQPTDSDQELRRRILADRDAIVLGHAEGSEVFEGVRARLEEDARKRAVRKDILEIVEDTHGRPVFEIFRLSPQ